MYDVLSVGNANIDLIINSDKLQTNQDLLLMPGGSACNFAVGCSRLGIKSSFLGFVGKDLFADVILDALKVEGVKPIVKVVNDHTGFVVVFTKGRFKKFFKFSGANAHLAKLKLKDYYNKARHLHLATPPLSLLKQAKGSISLDPGSTISDYSLDELKPYLKKVKIFFPNEDEAKKITGMPYVQAAKAFIDAGVEIVVIKRGRFGCYLRTASASLNVKALGYKPIDTTGAGDAFDSGFISAWLKGKSLGEACNWGMISSNICITKLGAQNSATMKELKKRLVNIN